MTKNKKTTRNHREESIENRSATVDDLDAMDVAHLKALATSLYCGFGANARASSLKELIRSKREYDASFEEPELDVERRDALASSLGIGTRRPLVSV